MQNVNICMHRDIEKIEGQCYGGVYRANRRERNAMVVSGLFSILHRICPQLFIMSPCVYCLLQIFEDWQSGYRHKQKVFIGFIVEESSRDGEVERKPEMAGIGEGWGLCMSMVEENSIGETWALDAALRSTERLREYNCACVVMTRGRGSCCWWWRERVFSSSLMFLLCFPSLCFFVCVCLSARVVLSSSVSLTVDCPPLHHLSSCCQTTCYTHLLCGV